MEYVLAMVRWPSFEAIKIHRAMVSGFNHVCDHFIPHPRNNYHPHILGHRALALFSVLLVSIKIFTIALVSFGPVIPAYSSAITSLNVINLTNQSRSAYSLSSLTESDVLAKAAQAKADDMASKGYFAHQSPDGRSPWDFIQSAGYNYLAAGENLAVNFTEAENVEQAWMNSAGHKANILNKNFEEIGIGIVEGQFQGRLATFVVQMFGTPVEQKISISDKPTAVQTAKAASQPAGSIANTVPVNPTVQSPVAAAETPKPEVLPLAQQELQITNPEITVDQNEAKIIAQVSSSAVKVIATFGQAAVMLEPKPEGLWEGEIDLSKLTQGKLAVKILAYDIQGKLASSPLADFTNNTADNYNVLGATETSKVQWLGSAINVNSLEQRFYLLFIAGILSSLILAIAVHRKIQHVALVANSSFVVVLAVLLWMSG